MLQIVWQRDGTAINTVRSVGDPRNKSVAVPLLSAKQCILAFGVPVVGAKDIVSRRGATHRCMLKVLD